MKIKIVRFSGLFLFSLAMNEKGIKDRGELRQLAEANEERTENPAVAKFVADSEYDIDECFRYC